MEEAHAKNIGHDFFKKVTKLADDKAKVQSAAKDKHGSQQTAPEEVNEVLGAWDKYRSKHLNTKFPRDLRYSSQLLVILNSAQSVREAFQNQYIIDRPRFTKNIEKGEDGRAEHGVVWSSGDPWRDQRRFTLSTFRSFGVGKRSFEEQISVEVRALCEEISAFKGESFNPRKLLANAVSNIICAVIFGKRFEYSDTAFHELLVLLDRTLEIAGAGSAELLIPILRYFNLASATEKEIHSISQQLKTYFRHMIDNHQEQFDPTDLRDYIDVYLNEIKQTEANGLSSHITVNNLQATVLQLFAAGSETTNTTIRWALLYMIAHPDIQRKVQHEIDNVVGRNRLPNLSDKEHMPYTEATIMEVQRIVSIVPVGVPHCAAEDTTLNGYNIPKNAIIMSNIWAIHHDLLVWDAPDTFRPERFLDDDGLVSQPDEYIPFSVGRRVCLGENLAKMELFIFFSHLLHRFTFRKPQGSSRLCFDGIIGATNAPHNYNIEAILRD
ncbi:cytochrome P450 2U1-like [Amphiura filiformis]|uniref:cytochrome P450 2U1-like n=1 Tax=Amphiura filiformis TaxID=82378 RepID=UPI003B212654